MATLVGTKVHRKPHRVSRKHPVQGPCQRESIRVPLSTEGERWLAAPQMKGPQLGEGALLGGRVPSVSSRVTTFFVPTTMIAVLGAYQEIPMG